MGFRRLALLTIVVCAVAAISYQNNFYLLRQGYWHARRGWALANGQLVDIGGYRLYISCRGSGTPVVVMDAGLETAGKKTWSAVAPAIAGYTTVCVYDRRGVGLSDGLPLGRHEADSQRRSRRSAFTPPGVRTSSALCACWPFSWGPARQAVRGASSRRRSGGRPGRRFARRSVRVDCPVFFRRTARSVSTQGIGGELRAPQPSRVSSRGSQRAHAPGRPTARAQSKRGRTPWLIAGRSRAAASRCQARYRPAERAQHSERRARGGRGVAEPTSSVEQSRTGTARQ